MPYNFRYANQDISYGPIKTTKNLKKKTAGKSGGENYKARLSGFEVEPGPGGEWIGPMDPQSFNSSRQ